LVADHVSVSVHITALMVCVWLLTQYAILWLSPTFPVKEAPTDNSQLTTFKQFKLQISWFLGIGFFCASLPEHIVADWATLFGKEELNLPASSSTLSYLVFTLGLIIGRFLVGYALKFQSESFWLRLGGIVGGFSFTLLIISSTLLIDFNRQLAITIAFLGFFLAGLGSSAMSPLFFSIAGRLSNRNSAIVVAQMSFVNVLMLFFARTILAWVIEATSITVALFIAAAAMSSLVYFGKIGSDSR
jgi:MFS family permease